MRVIGSFLGLPRLRHFSHNAPQTYKSRAGNLTFPDAMSIDTLLGLLNLESKSSNRLSGETSEFDAYDGNIDDSFVYSNVIYNTEVIKEAFDGAFFNPAHPKTRENDTSSNLISKSFEYPTTTDSSVAAFDLLLSPPDPTAQFQQFEQSFWKLDTLKYRKRAFVDVSGSFEAATESTKQKEIQPEDYENLLKMGNEGKEQKTFIPGFSTKNMKISNIFKKTMLVAPLKAVQIEAQVEAKLSKVDGKESITHIDDSKCVFETPKIFLVLDKTSLRLCSLEHLILFAEVYGCKIDYAAKRFMRNRTEMAIMKSMIAKVSEDESLNSIDASAVLSNGKKLDQNNLNDMLRFREDKPDSPITKSAPETTQEAKEDVHLSLPKEWTVEEDASLCGIIDSFRRRQTQINQKITAWIEANNLQPLLDWTRQKMAFQCENPFWELVAKEVGRSGKKRSGTGCRNRWLLLQRSRM